MSRLMRSIVLSVVTLLVCGIPAFAQTPVATPEPVAVGGLQEGASRVYTLDPDIIPADNPQDFVVINIHLFRFDSSENAAPAWESARSAVVAQIDPAAASGNAATNIQEEDVDDLGDQAYTAWLSSSSEDTSQGYYRVLYVQDGDYLYLLTAMGGSEENTLVLDEIAQVITERDAGSGPVSFNVDGSSSGGIWDKFPPANDEILNDFVPFSDKEVNLP